MRSALSALSGSSFASSPPLQAGRDHHAEFLRFFSSALHELLAVRGAQAPVLAGLGLGLSLVLAPAERPILWVRQEMADGEGGALYAPGLRQFGIDPARILLVRARDALAALQAGLEGARCPALGAVLVDLWGEARAYDLTASRRLACAARASGVPLFLGRAGARVRPSAAETRWFARPAPSRALPANAPGYPAFHLSLARARNAQDGRAYHLEWDRDARTFIVAPGHAGAFADEPVQALVPASVHASALSRSVVSFPADRPRPPGEGRGFARAR